MNVLIVIGWSYLGTADIIQQARGAEALFILLIAWSPALAAQRLGGKYYNGESDTSGWCPLIRVRDMIIYIDPMKTGAYHF
jgi:hypothetical protein